MLLAEPYSSPPRSPRPRPAAHTLSADIESLRGQKLQLVEERKNLHSRLAAASDSDARVGPRLLARLNREYHDLEAYVAAQRRELDERMSSDAAAVHSELQEEVKVVYLELLRLEEVATVQTERIQELRILRAELAEKLDPDVVGRRERKVHRYEEKLEKYQHANRKLQGRIRTARADRAFATQEGQRNINQRATELRGELESVREETAEIGRTASEEANRYRIEMRTIRKRTRGAPWPRAAV
jgi:hypothetical protein